MFSALWPTFDPRNHPATSKTVNTDDPTSAQNPPAPTPSFSDGQKLAGCYGLKRRLGAAGEPEVWLAHDEVLGKDVSLHFVPAALLGDAAAMNDLRREVKRTRQLIHPNILRVYDLVEDVGWAAVSMDAFEGESLAARLAKNVGEADGMQPWVSALCQTLEDAHKINVVHRDVAPGSIFLGGEGKVFVANFGLGRCMADALSRISAEPDPRLAAGSPQQLDGAAATRLDDVYAVGALMFEALTGRLPFVGDDVPGQIRNAAAPSVSALRGADAAPVPAAWVRTIAACLEKKPEARPQGTAEIARRLLATSVEKETAVAPAVVPKKFVPVETLPAVVPAPVVVETGRSVAPAAPKPWREPSATPAKLAPAVVSKSKSKFAPDVYSNLAPERPRFPALGFAVAAGLIVIGAAGYYFSGQGQGTQGAETSAGLTASEPPEGSELRSVNNRLETPALPAPRAAEETPEPAPAAEPVVAAPPVQPALLLAAAAPVATPAPAAVPAPAAAPAAASEEEKAVIEKAAALEKAKQAALTAQKSRDEMAKQQQAAEAAVAEAQKAIEQKTKAMGPVKKGAEEVLAQRKKLEDEQKAADLAAEQARQLAAEKARVAEAAKKAIADLESKNKDKLAAQDKADAEIATLQKNLADRQQSAAGAAKAATDAEAARQQHLTMVKQGEQEVEQARLAAAEARRAREEAEAERRKLGVELAEMQKMMEKKKAEIEDRLKKLENPVAKPPVVVAPAPEPVKAPEPKPVEKPSTPMPAVKPVSVSTPAPATPVPATPVPVAILPKPPVATPAPVAVAVEPKPATPATSLVATEATQLVMKTDPEKVASLVPPAVPKVTAPAVGGENSLGMRFAPVGDVDFCVWQTRVKDFDVFARAVNLKSSAWRSPGFKQSAEHPVVNVTWVEAVAFCKWLTDLEHKDGTLAATQFYRLPTDLEWSKAVGLPEEAGKTPEARDMGVSDVYPWGTQWPPPPNSGNYTGEETGSDVAIKGYDDGFAWTSPVGSFPPNKLGLYDMGGNVWQWCMDTWNSDSKAKVLRGASWYNGALKLSLLSSCRVHASPDSSTDNYGFRIVRTSDAGKSGRR